MISADDKQTFSRMILFFIPNPDFGDVYGKHQSSFYRIPDPDLLPLGFIGFCVVVPDGDGPVIGSVTGWRPLLSYFYNRLSGGIKNG